MIQPPRPDKVDVALLYQDYEPFKYVNLVERLSLIFGDNAPVGLGQHEDGSWGVVTIGGIVLKISQNPVPLGPEGFASALASPFTQNNRPDAQALVQSHRKTIFVTVGSSDILTDFVGQSDVAKRITEILGEETFAVKTPSKETFSDWMFVAQLVASHIAKMTNPILIHWCQSDQLLTPDQLDMTADPRAMNVQIHPSLFSSGNDEQGRQKIGFHAYGSEHITGYHMIFEETHLRFERVREVAHDFIYGLSKSSDVPTSGEIVRMKSGAALRLHLKEAGDAHPRPYLSLEVLELGKQAPKPDIQQRLQGAFEAYQSKASQQAPPAKPKPGKVQKKRKPFLSTFFGQVVVLIGLIIVFGLQLGVVAFAGFLAWTQFKTAKTA